MLQRMQLFLIFSITNFIIFVIQFNAVNGVEYYTEKPAFLPTCQMFAPNFTKCSTNTIQTLMNHMVLGDLPEITEAFGPLDPLKVKDIEFKQDNNAAATLSANLTEVILQGLANILIKQNKVNLKDLSWKTKIFLPKLRIDGKYKMNGRILLIPLKGHGNLYIEIENCDIIIRSKSRLFEKGGFTFDNVTSIHVEYLNMTRVRTHLDNLFNGQSKEIERSTNDFFNENWRDFFEALRPLISKTIENVLFDILHKVFILIPANFFASDIPTSTQFYANTKKN